MDSEEVLVMADNPVTEGEELALRQQWDEVLPMILDDRTIFDDVRLRFQAISEKRESVEEVGKPKTDMAEELRAWFESWYRALGFAVRIPTKPAVSNREFRKRERKGQALFYRPLSHLVTYDAYMNAVGQGTHWTVKDQGSEKDAKDRAKIVWEPAGEGHWFWAEVSPQCPRLATTWNVLTKQIRLLSLEEYAIVWHAWKAMKNIMLDTSTWTWLRTRFGQGALLACEGGGQVIIGMCGAEFLAFPYDSWGGRCSEVVHEVKSEV